jgi:hypothetical protein
MIGVINMENSSYIGAFNVYVGDADVKIDFYKVEPIYDETGIISKTEKELAHRVTLPISGAEELSRLIDNLIKAKNTVNTLEAEKPTKE